MASRDDLTARIERLELAVLTVARATFGDVDGHDFHGNQWTGGRGGGDTATDVDHWVSAEGHERGSGSMSDPIRVRDVNEAMELLAQGKFVDLPPNTRSIFMDKFAAAMRDAREKGEKAPTYDLCKLSEAGTNLFCGENKGIARIDMPQLSGTPLPGSTAAGLEKDKDGKVDITDAFREYLHKEGYGFSDESVQSDYLKATQNELNGAKVAGLMDHLASGGEIPGRIFVSRDNYVLDGHHRWAADVGLTYIDGEANYTNVTKVDLPISVLLPLAKGFAAGMGLPQQGV